MATLQYTTWWSAAEVANGPVMHENVITIGVASATSPTVVDPTGRNETRRVRISVDADCWVTWGLNPTASTDGTGGRMMGPTVSACEYFDIPSNESIAVIQR